MQKLVRIDIETYLRVLDVLENTTSQYIKEVERLNKVPGMLTDSDKASVQDLYEKVEDFQSFLNYEVRHNMNEVVLSDRAFTTIRNILHTESEIARIEALKDLERTSELTANIRDYVTKAKDFCLFMTALETTSHA